MTDQTPWHCPSAWKQIRHEYLQYLHGIDVQTIVEIGVHYGYSLFALAHDFPKAHVVGIDNFSFGDSEDARGHLNEHLHKFPNIRIWEATSAEALNMWRQPDMFLDIDILHIDADHTIEGVRFDFENWSPMVRPGGVVMFHDINVKDFGVREVFDSLPGKKAVVNSGPGLGIWFKDEI